MHVDKAKLLNSELHVLLFFSLQHACTCAHTHTHIHIHTHIFTVPQVTFETAAVNVFENQSSIGIDLLRSGRDFGQTIEVFIKSRDDNAIGKWGIQIRLDSHLSFLRNWCTRIEENSTHTCISWRRLHCLRYQYCFRTRGASQDNSSPAGTRRCLSRRQQVI